MSKIVAIDPGTTQSAVVEWDGRHIIEAEILPNDRLLEIIRIKSIYRNSGRELLAIEKIASYGMPVGEEVFATVLWCGRFIEAFGGREGQHYWLVPRKEMKLHHCHNPRANDSNIRQALVDRFGAPGTKKNPGLTYGLKKDLWQAFALAVQFSDTHPELFKGEQAA